MRENKRKEKRKKMGREHVYIFIKPSVFAATACWSGFYKSAMLPPSFCSILLYFDFRYKIRVHTYLIYIYIYYISYNGMSIEYIYAPGQLGETWPPTDIFSPSLTTELSAFKRKLRIFRDSNTCKH